MQRITLTCVLLLSGLLNQTSAIADGPSLSDVRGAIVSVRWNAGSPPGAEMGFRFVPSEGEKSVTAQITANVEVDHAPSVSNSKNVNALDVTAQNVEHLTTNDAFLVLSREPKYTKSTQRATGFIMGQRVISILNAEARQSDSLVVINPDGGEHKPTILAWDPATGLTAFEVKSDMPEKPATGLNLAEKLVEWGEPVRVAHEWRTGNPALITGTVSTTPEYDGAVRAMTFDIDGHFSGNTTGAPVLNAANEVVGIVNGQRSSSGDAGSGIAVQVDKIRSLLAFVDSGSKGAMPKPMIGVALALTPDGTVVEKVIEDSPASSAGLKTGDLIIWIDGHKATRPEDIIAAVEIGRDVDDRSGAIGVGKGFL